MGFRHRWNYEKVVAELSASEIRTLNIPVAGKINIALIYPGPYSLGISNLGFQAVHRLAGSVPGIGTERFFFPVEAGKPHPPPFYSFETRRPLGDFDVLAFSISFEEDFERLAMILGPLGIPVDAKDRGPRHPLLIAGGAAVGANPEALSRVMDILIPGEAETTWTEVLRNLLVNGGDLDTLAEFPGVWIPGKRSRVNEAPEAFDVNSSPAFSHVISPVNVFGGAYLLEIMRGCPRVCRFCLARVLYKPARPVSSTTIDRWLDANPRCSDLGLVAPSLFDHPELVRILEILSQRKIRLRNSSVKWEKLSDRVLNLLLDCGVRGLTLAPESGSLERLSDMGKPLPSDPFFATLRRVLDHGIEHLKMYFMVGLPNETDQDVQMTVGLIREVVMRFGSRLKGLGVSISGFVPKRGTPWENEEVADQSVLRKRFDTVRHELKALGFPGLVVQTESPQGVVQQARLARLGGEFVDHLRSLAEAYRRKGATRCDLPDNWEF